MSKESDFTRVYPHAAAIDVGSETFFVSTGAGTVKSFGTLTFQINVLRDYLKEEAIEHVAIDATGVYWFSLYDVLEDSGFKVCLIHGGHAKNMPGRKTDVLDCQWYQQLFSHGLLRSCFVPNDAIRKLRSYNRLRQDHIRTAASNVQHMQKALTLMNIRLHNVISQLNGVSGMRIVKAILEGERNAERLADLCDKQIQKKRHLVIASLEGNYREEHLFALRQALASYEFYQARIAECDRKIEALLSEMTQDLDEPEFKTKTKKIRANHPDIKDLHRYMVKMAGGRDIAAVCGLTDAAVLKLIGETGTDMSPWPHEKHFTSWANLAPGADNSGKRKRNKRRGGHTKVGQILRECAMSVGRSKDTALGAFYRRIAARRGAPIAIVATARKLAVLYYRLLKYGFDYVEVGLQEYQKHYEAQQRRYLEKQARKLGFTLLPVAT